MSINCNSTGALSIASNSMLSSRTRHFVLHFCFLRELIKKNRITVHDKTSQAMLADNDTNYIAKQQFSAIMLQINFSNTSIEPKRPRKLWIPPRRFKIHQDPRVTPALSRCLICPAAKAGTANACARGGSAEYDSQTFISWSAVAL